MSKERALSYFSQRLKLEREKKGISQQKLADIIGTQKQMIAKYENIGENSEKGYPNVLTAKRLTDALDITLNDLFNIDAFDNKEVGMQFRLIADILDGVYNDWSVMTNIMTAVYTDNDECIEDKKYQVAITTNKYPYGAFVDKYRAKMRALNEIEEDYSNTNLYHVIREQVINEYVEKYKNKWIVSSETKEK